MSSSLRNKSLPPLLMPVIFFAAVIVIGAILLHESFSLNGAPISWLDAVFTAASATCVTGLAVVDTGTCFSRNGQVVIMLLIQLGGLGIMTFTSLAFYLVRQQVSLTDRIAVGQALIPQNRFAMGEFLKAVLVGTFCIEAAGAGGLYFLAPPGSFDPFSAVFHAVSAFCNAGFSLHADSLSTWRGNWTVNLIVMALIISGGLGFSVLLEIRGQALDRLHRRRTRSLSWHAHIVIKVTIFLIVSGWFALFVAEYVGFHRQMSFADALISTLFQSVTCRTAGFNTLDISGLTNVSLFVMVILMFIGGAPGSCAGGIKVTTFRTLAAFVSAQLRGRSQARAGRFAIEHEAVNKALILLVVASAIVVCATLALSMTEGGDLPHPQTRGLMFEVLFEAVSAFGTVGLSTGLTPHLSAAGKVIITVLMFVGRLGPLVFLSAIKAGQRPEFYELPEEDLLIG